jgi:chaperonin GroES
MKNIKPVGKRVIVKRVETVTRTKTGLIIPEKSQEAPTKATVIESNGDLMPGTIVYFSNFAGIKIKFNEEDVIVLDETDILAKEI